MKTTAKKQKPDEGTEQVARVRRICASLPETWEKLSHGEPTFFVGKRVFAMCSINHHHDGHIAVTIPAAIGVQAALIESNPKKFYRPRYVGPAGWVGIELPRVTDKELALHLLEAWRLIAPEKLHSLVADTADAPMTMSRSHFLKRRDPFPFVLDELSPLRPNIKRMFGFTSVYLEDKLLCSLRDSETRRGSNGIWLYTTTEHLESLAREFPELPKRQLWRSGKNAWVILASRLENFEEFAFKACELMLRGDQRIGRITRGGAQQRIKKLKSDSW